MNANKTNRCTKKLTHEQIASNARIEAARAETRNALTENKCPRCGRAVRRNLSLTGWVVCTQRGAVGFRADASVPSCDWDGFTGE